MWARSGRGHGNPQPKDGMVVASFRREVASSCAVVPESRLACGPFPVGTDVGGGAIAAETTGRSSSEAMAQPPARGRRGLSGKKKPSWETGLSNREVRGAQLMVRCDHTWGRDGAVAVSCPQDIHRRCSTGTGVGAALPPSALDGDEEAHVLRRVGRLVVGPGEEGLLEDVPDAGRLRRSRRGVQEERGGDSLEDFALDEDRRLLEAAVRVLVEDGRVVDSGALTAVPDYLAHGLQLDPSISRVVDVRRRLKRMSANLGRAAGGP